MTVHAGHRIQACKHGILVSQCRCMAPEKPVVTVPCPTWCPKYGEEPSGMQESHPSPAAGPYAPSAPDPNLASIKMWMALDLWMALGWDHISFRDHYDNLGFDKTWKHCLDEVTKMREWKRVREQ